MEIFKIIGVGLLGAIMTLMLKEAKSELSIMTVLATGIIILIIILNALSDVVLAFNSIVDKSGISSVLFSGLMKIIGIGYVTEYSNSICEDLGVKSIGTKIQLAGKITIFLMAMPIVTALIETVASIVGG